MNKAKTILRWALKAILGFAFFVVGYFALAFVLTWLPVNSSFQPPKQGVEIFLKSNGVHTDLVLPVRHALWDWRSKFDTTVFKPERQPLRYVSIGWGDKGFYLYTPTWADLKFSTAFSAMFLFTPTAMHVTYKTDIPRCGELVKRVLISEAQYKQLIDYVLASFQQAGDGTFLRINATHYSGANDHFYEANGRYFLFKTCNVWTNSALKEIGVKTAFWAPFDKCVLYHFN